MQHYALLMARLMMAFIFLFAGYNKASNPAPTEGFMHVLGLPGATAYLVILLEIGGGLLLVLGVYTRVVALLLAGFCMLTAFLVHFHTDDPGNMLHFMKNTCMAGGFLALCVAGGGKISLGEKLKLKLS